MTQHEHWDKKLINTEKTWKIVVCLNPKHDTIRFKTNEIGIECPLCRTLMVTEIISPFDIIRNDV